MSPSVALLLGIAAFYLFNVMFCTLAAGAWIGDHLSARGWRDPFIMLVALALGWLWPLLLIFAAVLLATTKLKELIRR